MNRKVIKYSLLSLIILVLSFYFITSSNVENKYDGDYTIPILKEDTLPTSISKTIIKPYTNNSVLPIINYYDEEDDFESQTKSIVLYGDTYIKSTGIVYGCNEQFNVVSILDGEVISVNETQNLGVAIEIKHSNDMISVYQTLSDSIVKVGEKVKQGQIIGNSGTTNITSKSDNQLYFELISSGKIVNPNNYFNKEI